MRRSVGKLGLRVLALCNAVLVVACAGRTGETREYVLTARDTRATSGHAPNEAHIEEGGDGAVGPIIGVGPVVVPAYLRRRQIVTREEGYRVRASDTHQWGEDLEAGVTRCLAEHLAAMVPADRVARFPWPAPAPPDYRVTVEVERFERAGDTVELDARWVLSGRSARDALGSGVVALKEPAEARGYPETVAAMSRAIGELGREVADAIHSHREGAADAIIDEAAEPAEAAVADGEEIAP